MPRLEQRVKELGNRHKGTLMVKIDVDNHQDLCDVFSVDSIPCLILVKNGEVVEKIQGRITDDKLDKFLSKVSDNRS